MDGVINIYKHKGITSFEAVRKIKRLANTGKVGHTGTLDPLAEGVLPICIGKATKLVDYIMDGEKEYRATLKLGVVTDTYDLEGKILKESTVNLKEEEVKKAVLSFIGESYQTPPMYSAIKVKGQKLYELARKGIEIEREKRKIFIRSINIEKIQMPFVTFTVKCSKGTYIRSLCYDIGELLSCGAVMTELIRTASGSFNSKEAISLEDLTENNINKYIVSTEEVLKEFNKVYSEDKFVKLLLNGVKLQDENFLSKVKEEGKYTVYTKEGKFIGLGVRDFKSFKLLLRFN